MLKKTIAAVGILGALVMVSGFSFAEVGEYFQVTRNRISQSLQRQIPLDVEIERLELLLEKTDQQVSRQKFHVAKAKVALEESQFALQRDKQVCQNLYASMRNLRDAQRDGGEIVQVGCHSVPASDVNRALAYKLASYKNRMETVSHREKSIQHQTVAFNNQFNSFGEWEQKRKMLALRVETLKARLSTHLATATKASEGIPATELVRATELADDIERKLKIAETERALGTSTIDTFSDIKATQNTNVVAEIDQLLESSNKFTASN